MSLSPFQILGVSADATDDQIRAAYLRKVRQHPPEQDPETFRLVQQAYESIRDIRARIAYELFHVPDWQAISASVHRFQPRPTREQFQAMLRACAEQMTEDDK